MLKRIVCQELAKLNFRPSADLAEKNKIKDEGTVIIQQVMAQLKEIMDWQKQDTVEASPQKQTTLLEEEEIKAEKATKSALGDELHQVLSMHEEPNQKLDDIIQKPKDQYQCQNDKWN